ncbi:Hypothetical_protein [Hexamita inflata]|uniref:Hypothetical_protein n=1 Tax=Hexamita inflata TaxID=28002 RepID=A0AA86P3Y1_9EUKA|nr:Hypothetical protein HINF_LOCUS18853 [Hexamita inflata]
MEIQMEGESKYIFCPIQLIQKNQQEYNVIIYYSMRKIKAEDPNNVYELNEHTEDNRKCWMKSYQTMHLLVLFSALFRKQVWCTCQKHLKAVQGTMNKFIRFYTGKCENSVLYGENACLVRNQQLIVSQVGYAQIYLPRSYSGGPSKCFFELGRRMKFII